MASTGRHVEFIFLGIRFGPMAKSLTAQKLLRKFGGGGLARPPLGITRVKLATDFNNNSQEQS